MFLPLLVCRRTVMKFLEWWDVWKTTSDRFWWRSGSRNFNGIFITTRGRDSCKNLAGWAASKEVCALRLLLSSLGMCRRHTGQWRERRLLKHHSTENYMWIMLECRLAYLFSRRLLKRPALIDWSEDDADNKIPLVQYSRYMRTADDGFTAANQRSLYRSRRYLQHSLYADLLHKPTPTTRCLRPSCLRAGQERDCDGRCWRRKALLASIDATCSSPGISSDVNNDWTCKVQGPGQWQGLHLQLFTASCS